ncbi:MAG: hypothetical protein IPK91_15445 [Saprospiraceae bacterium]|nr:hypothetical protein [Saprospiraceae bacterium]
MNKTNCLLSALLCLFLNMLSAQETVTGLLQFKNQRFQFENGDSMVLDPDKQLIVLLFHAEQDTIGLDPGLSTEGRWRAINLLRIMKTIEFGAFFTTPFRNNILTLQPLVDYKKTQPRYYDQSDIQVLIKEIANLSPYPIMVMVHPETVGLIFERITQSKLTMDISTNRSDKMILIQRDRKQGILWKTCTYKVR